MAEYPERWQASGDEKRNDATGRRLEAEILFEKSFTMMGFPG
jgi:hypothetical protein